MGINCKYCLATAPFGSTQVGWRLAKNAPFQYVCPKCVSEGKS